MAFGLYWSLVCVPAYLLIYTVDQGNIFLFKITFFSLVDFLKVQFKFSRLTFFHSTFNMKKDWRGFVYFSLLLVIGFVSFSRHFAGSDLSLNVWHFIKMNKSRNIQYFLWTMCTGQAAAWLMDDIRLGRQGEP